MNQLEKIDLNKLEAKDGVLTIKHETLPTQKVETIHEEEHVSLKGTIKAPANFWEKRSATVTKLKAHVKYSYRDRTISLVTEENFSKLGEEVTGSLNINPEFNAFGINIEKMFKVNDLVKHVRMNKFLFADKDVHAKILSSLKSFSANVESEIRKVNDGRGNIEDVYKTTMKSNAELNFNILAPIFIGEPAKSFNVEICCQADNSEVKFWFESTDLINLFKQDSENIINKELERFDTALVFIEQ